MKKTAQKNCREWLVCAILALAIVNVQAATTTVHENGEDGDTVNWAVYDNDPAGSVIENTIDTLSPVNRAIKLTGTDLLNGFKYTFPVSEQSQFKIRWRMKFSDSYNIYLSCQTTAGHRYIYYTNNSDDFLGSGTSVHHGLGPETISGAWVTVLRDLQKDLHDAQPDCDIISVDAFLVRGSGYIDDITSLDYADSDLDLIPDADEIALGLDPNNSDSDGNGIPDTLEDSDSDGLSNVQETALTTNLGSVDTDSDGLLDWFEVYDSLTNPLSDDTDSNGTTDAQENPDEDAYTNLQEQLAGTDPLDAASQGPGYTFEQSIQENAESGSISNWDIYDNDPAGASLSNIVDPQDLENRVIQFSSNELQNGYRYTFASAERSQFKIQWRMKYAESYTIYISCQTTEGHRYIYYTASSASYLGTGGAVHHGLGPYSKSNSWITVRRDLEQDLWAAQPDNNIISVNAFLIRGSGLIDNITTLAYLDSDHDLLPDELESAIGLDAANPADAGDDFDNDGLTNLDEVIYGTDLDNSDSDADGLTDKFELIDSATNPMNNDSNSNGISDADEDPDGDGLSNLEEQNAGMNPNLPANDGNGFKFEETVRLDGEDETINGWSVYDKDPAGAVITNSEDPDNFTNRVIQFSGSNIENGYILSFGKAEHTQFKIQWSMRFTESYIIYISCHTTAGHRYIYYTASSNSTLGSGSVHHGLGPDSRAGQWVTIRRDLVRDLQLAQPDNKLLSVEAFLVRGSGYVDNISTLTYPDMDHDLIPDEVETAAGLNPNDPNDAAADADDDGVSNLDEFLEDTLLTNTGDSDNDQLSDEWEMTHFGNLDQTADGDADNDGLTNLEEMNLETLPNSSDTDGDGMPDGWEVTYTLDPKADDAGLDKDNDNIPNIREFLLDTDPATAQTRDSGGSLLLTIFQLIF